MEEQEMKYLIEQYQLTPDVLSKPVSDEHILEIRKSFPWRDVGEYLLGRGARFNDIDRDGHDESEKRRLTLDKWQEGLGDDATYGKLVEAMVKAGKCKDASEVCCLIKPAFKPEAVNCNSTTPPPGSTAAALEDEKVLYNAAERGDMSAVRQLIASPVNVDCTPYEGGATPLMAASCGGHVHIVRLLIEAKVQVNTQKEDGWTALHMAAQGGKVDVVELLLKAKAHVNIQAKDGETALFMACWKGHLPVVRLLQKYADVNICKKDGVSPLFIACQEGHSEVVDVLLKNGADIEKPMNDGATPLFIASYSGHSDIVNTLITNGAVINQPKKDGWRPIDIARSKGNSDIVHILEKAEE